MLPAAGPAPLVLPILCRSCASKTPAVPCKHPNYSLENRVSIASTGYRQPIRFRPGILRYPAGIGAIPENTLFLLILLLSYIFAVPFTNNEFKRWGYFD